MVGKLTPDTIMSASRIPQMLGLSPYATQNELLADFIAIDEGKEPTRTPENEVMFWGNVHEGAIIRETARRLGLVDVQDDFDSAFFHDKLPIACSLDGQGIGIGEVKTDPAKGVFCVDSDAFVIDGRAVLVECKSTQSAPEEHLPPWRGPLQLHGQMMCTGVEYGAVAVLYRGSTLRIWLYKRNDALVSNITDNLMQFEERRTKKDWYPLASSDDGNVAYATADDGADPLPVYDDQVQHAIETLVEAKRLKREADESIKDCEAIIKEFMGNHEQASTVCDGKRVIIKWGMRNVKAQPEKIVPAKPAERVRQNTLTVKELGDA